MKQKKPENDYVAIAIEARRNASNVENLLWEGLCRNQVEGCHFRRKHFIDNYLVDFCCLSRKLAIFIEGSNTDAEEYQAEAMAACMANGFRVVTFRAADILHDLDHVLKTISLLVMLDNDALKKDTRAERKTLALEEYRKRDKLRGDVDYLRGHPANAEGNAWKIMRNNK